MMPRGLLFLDCDSTLSAVEGIDELARARGPECFAQVEHSTRLAMEGALPIADVFGARLDIIRPARDECAAVARLYLETVAPGADTAIKAAVADGWHPVILSGGFAPCILPLADSLGIPDVEAVPLYFNDDGSYAGYGRDFPTTRNGGKPDVIRHWRGTRPAIPAVMIGDGVSDLETAPVVDLFIGFGGFVDRPRVRAEAGQFITSFDELPPLLSAL